MILSSGRIFTQITDWNYEMNKTKADEHPWLRPKSKKNFVPSCRLCSKQFGFYRHTNLTSRIRLCNITVFRFVRWIEYSNSQHQSIHKWEKHPQIIFGNTRQPFFKTTNSLIISLLSLTKKHYMDLFLHVIKFMINILS